MMSGIVTRRWLAIVIVQVGAVLAIGARDIAAQDAVPPPARVMTCPSGLNGSTAAIDAAGRFIVYTVSTGSSLCCQIRVLDTSANTDRVVLEADPRGTTAVLITDDGRYVLHRKALGWRAFDTTTGVTIDFPFVPVDRSTVTLRLRTPTGNLSGSEASSIIEAGSASGLSNLANYVTGHTAPALLAPGVPAGSYFARVRALNVCGAGPASNEIVVTVR